MKKLLLFFFIQSFTMCAQEWRWAKDNGTWSIPGRSQIEAHPSGDVYTAVTNTIWPSQIVFKKENTHGVPIWIKNISGSNSFITGLTVDQSNNSYLMGFFANNLVLPDTTIYNSGSYELFIAAYNSGGDRKWLKVIPEISNWSAAITSDESGNIIVAGSAASGTDTFYIKKFTHAGSIIWQKTFACNSAITGMAIDKLANINLYGNFTGINLDINGINHYSSNGTSYYWKSFIAKLNPAGELKKIVITEGTQIKDLGADSTSSNYFITGTFSDSALIGNTKLKTACSSYNNNVCEESFAARLDSGNTCQWAYANKNIFKQIETTPGGGSYLTGTFSNTMSLGGISLKETTTRGSVFVAHLNISGNALWAIKDSGAYQTTNHVEDLSVDKEGSFYLSGTFHNYYGNCWFGAEHLPLTGAQTHYFSVKLQGTKTMKSLSYHEVTSNYLFPNPSEGKFVAPEQVIRISDCLGKNIPFAADASGQNINVPATSGLYFVELSSGAVLKLLLHE